MTILKQSTVYTTSDGKTYPDHKTAKVAQDVIDRLDRVDGVIGSIADHLSGDRVSAYQIAQHGPAFLEALTLPSGRKPRTLKPAELTG